MAKKTVASLQKKGAKAFTKAIKMVKNENGSYSFKSEIVPVPDKVNVSEPTKLLNVRSELLALVVPS